MTTLIDEMDDRVAGLYAAWPNRLYLIDAAGRVAYRSRPNPRGFKVAELARRLGLLDLHTEPTE